MCSVNRLLLSILLSLALLAPIASSIAQTTEAPEPNQMLVARPVAQLHQTKPVAARNQAHGFGIDRNRRAGREQVDRGNIFFVKVDRHDGPNILAKPA